MPLCLEHNLRSLFSNKHQLLVVYMEVWRWCLHPETNDHCWDTKEVTVVAGKKDCNKHLCTCMFVSLLFLFYVTPLYHCQAKPMYLQEHYSGMNKECNFFHKFWKHFDSLMTFQHATLNRNHLICSTDDDASFVCALVFLI